MPLKGLPPPRCDKTGSVGFNSAHPVGYGLAMFRIGILHRLTDQHWHDHSKDAHFGSGTGHNYFKSHSELLLVPPAHDRKVRISCDARQKPCSVT